MTKTIKNCREKDNGVSCNSYINSVLPDAILIEIFLRLPIVVIMNCKLMCKSWYKLLSDSNFTINYLRNPVYTSFVPVDRNKFYMLEFSKNGNCSKIPFYPKLPPDWLARDPCFDFIGSCNGLLCICILKPGVEIVFVCNPLMGEYIALPQHQSYDDDMKARTYKFGFIPSTSTFKVLRITYTPRQRGVYKTTRSEIYECHIFTIGVDDIWRSLDVPCIKSFFRPSVLLNGALHVIDQVTDEGPFSIRTFDFAEERAGQISHPLDVVMDRNMSLKLFDNQLGLVDYSIKSRFTIWRMKEYGNVESWTKNVIQKHWFPSGMRSRRLLPFGVLQNGDTLFSHINFLLSCNTKQKKCSKIEQFDGFHFMVPYAPSFSLMLT